MIDTIKSRKDFLKIQITGDKAVTAGFILQSAINKNCNKVTRFGFTASRKEGSAVLRNKGVKFVVFFFGKFKKPVHKLSLVEISHRFL